jgi:hypothetical protein
MPAQNQMTKGASNNQYQIEMMDLQPLRDAIGGSKKSVIQTAHIIFGGFGPRTPDRPWGQGYNVP